MSGAYLTENPASTANVLMEVGVERERQFEKWGPQHHPDGTATPLSRELADNARDLCDKAAQQGRVTWNNILTEETFEALAEKDPVTLRKELIQVAAVAVAWVEDIDSRAKPSDHHELGEAGG